MDAPGCTYVMVNQRSGKRFRRGQEKADVGISKPTWEGVCGEVRKDIKVGILTISDRAAQGVYTDRSGPRLRERFKTMGRVRVIKYEIVPDELDAIAAKLPEWCDHDQLDLVLTIGGTGLGPRDVTPEATRRILDKEVPGLAEVLRSQGSQTTSMAWLSRSVAGLRRRTLIVNLPGHPEAVEQGFQILAPLLPHALAMIRGEPHPDSHSRRPPPPPSPPRGRGRG